MRLAAATLLALLMLAGCAGPATDPPATSATPGPTTAASPAAPSSPAAGQTPTAPVCRGTHAHATFAVFGQSGGEPHRIDYAAPRSDQGRAWYDLGVSPTMTLAVHLHQQGAEQGSDALGPAQFHYEAAGRCPTIAQSMAAVETLVEAGGITLFGGHARAQQDTMWAGPVRAWLQAPAMGEGGCAWRWAESSTLADWLGHAPKDGEAMLAAAGTFTDAQVAAMQQAVPAPMTRAAEPACP